MTAAVETDDPVREKRHGLIVAGAFFLLFLGGAAFIPMDSGAVATGTVAVSGNRQAVQHRDGGIVSELKVREGQTVKKGQALLIIATNEIAAGERGLAAETYGLMAQRQRLLAERDGAAGMTPPAEFAALVDADRLLAMDAWQGQMKLFAARRGSTHAQHDVLSQRTRQNDQQISGFAQQMKSNREQRRLLDEEIMGLRQIVEKGWASINRIRALERAAAQLDGDYAGQKAEIARLREATGEVSMQSLSFDRKVTEDVSEQLRDVSLKLDANLPKLAAAREQLARAQVRAPASGKIVGLKVFTVGGVVQPGQVLMEVVPQDRELVIEAMISPRDADDIAPGQRAQTRFSSIQERNIPILNGVVSRISADSFTDERSGEKFFRAEIRVPQSELDKVRMVRPGKSAIQAGLPAEILIPLRKRSMLGYLLEPLTQSLWLAGREH